MRLLIAVAALAATLALTTSAAAMVGMFNSPGKITGSSVKVTGPVSFSSDEAGAVIHATVLQNGKSTSGDSAYVPASASSWSATTSGDRLSPGHATAKAVATVYNRDGSTERYSWVTQIDLK